MSNTRKFCSRSGCMRSVLILVVTLVAVGTWRYIAFRAAVTRVRFQLDPSDITFIEFRSRLCPSDQRVGIADRELIRRCVQEINSMSWSCPWFGGGPPPARKPAMVVVYGKWGYNIAAGLRLAQSIGVVVQGGRTYPPEVVYIRREPMPTIDRLRSYFIFAIARDLLRERLADPTRDNWSLDSDRIELINRYGPGLNVPQPRSAAELRKVIEEIADISIDDLEKFPRADWDR